MEKLWGFSDVCSIIDALRETERRHNKLTLFHKMYAQE